MDIIWLQYKCGTKTNYHLALPILEDDEKLSALLCERVTDLEIERIRKHAQQLSILKVEERLEWFKNNITSFQSALKEFKKGRYTIDKVFGVASL